MVAVHLMTLNTAREETMKQENTALAKYLKTSRINSNLSQAEVAAKLGYKTPQFISNWERGVSQPPISAIDTLAEIYAIQPDQLFQIILETSLNQVGQNMRMQYKNRKKSG